jgi:PIN domain nuclease of toxin-antitoxin system
MRYLLDTHTLLWAFNDSPSLTPRARRVIEDGSNDLMVSAASAWEIATKARLGKLPSGDELIADLDRYLAQLGCEALPISLDHAVRAGRLPGEHRDPFDRMLIAQAQAENLAIISNDRIFDTYRVPRVW